VGCQTPRPAGSEAPGRSRFQRRSKGSKSSAPAGRKSESPIHPGGCAGGRAGQTLRAAGAPTRSVKPAPVSEVRRGPVRSLSTPRSARSAAWQAWASGAGLRPPPCLRGSEPRCRGMAGPPACRDDGDRHRSSEGAASARRARLAREEGPAPKLRLAPIRPAARRRGGARGPACATRSSSPAPTRRSGPSIRKQTRCGAGRRLAGRPPSD